MITCAKLAGGDPPGAKTMTYIWCSRGWDSICYVTITKPHSASLHSAIKKVHNMLPCTEFDLRFATKQVTVYLFLSLQVACSCWSSLLSFIIHLTHANVCESVGKPCSYTHFLKSCIFCYKSRKNPYQVLQVMCTERNVQWNQRFVW